MRSSANRAIEAGAGFLFTSTPIPLLRSMAAAAASAGRDTGRIATMGRQTKCRHLGKSRPTIFRTNDYYQLSVGLGRLLLAPVVPRRAVGMTCDAEGYR